VRPHLQLVDRGRPRALSGAEIQALTKDRVAAYRARKECQEGGCAPADRQVAPAGGAPTSQSGARAGGGPASSRPVGLVPPTPAARPSWRVRLVRAADWLSQDANALLLITAVLATVVAVLSMLAWGRVLHLYGEPTWAAGRGWWM
jgi:hypothetical protein